ncbi:MAG: phosphoenolpyruvate--protein phosphotransferase [Anaerolinea sp.]|nr:phosphoenolpyruvate--protein phosphotransferase [Anaerolinea sp.]
MKTQGIPASPGIAIGPAFIFKPVQVKIESYKVDNVSHELDRLDAAISTANAELADLQSAAKERAGAQEAAIFDAHAMMLADPSLRRASHRAITKNHINAEAAIYQSGESFAQKLENVPDELIRQRAVDVRDVVRRVVRILTGASDSPFAGLTSPSVIFADDLTPSDTIQLDKTVVLGIYARQGSRTSHAAILARSLAIPAVVGGELSLDQLQNGITSILDGDAGTIHIQPDAATLASYQAQLHAKEKVQAENLSLAAEPAQTLDGIRVEVAANIGGLQDARTAVASGAEAVGLLRTEFLFLENSHMPDENEQYAAYRSILDVLSPRPVILRTLDIGGDKRLPYFAMPEERNPFLGVRAVRLCFQSPELWIPQLRAALRAGHGHQLRFMFPMIANLGEVRRAKQVVEECKDALRKEGQTFIEDVEIGIMIEIPSAALMTDILAPEVDFFSIGTNDLSQYTFAADRMNPAVAEIANPLDPALLRLVKHTVDGAHLHGKWVGMCGELAGERLAIPILLGLGLDEFSMNPSRIPAAKALIRQFAVKDCQELAEQALSLESAEAVETLVHKFLKEHIN